MRELWSPQPIAAVQGSKTGSRCGILPMPEWNLDRLWSTRCSSVVNPILFAVSARHAGDASRRRLADKQLSSGGTSAFIEPDSSSVRQSRRLDRSPLLQPLLHPVPSVQSNAPRRCVGGVLTYRATREPMPPRSPVAQSASNSIVVPRCHEPGRLSIACIGAGDTASLGRRVATSRRS